jgi:hypothetical protein
MKPKRVAMTHDLIVNYDLYHDMKVYVGHILTRGHSMQPRRSS